MCAIFTRPPKDWWGIGSIASIRLWVSGLRASARSSVSQPRGFLSRRARTLYFYARWARSTAIKLTPRR